MHRLFLHSSSPVLLLLAKEFVSEYRNRYACSVILAFSVITVTSISISLANSALSEETESVLLWIIIFFSAMAGLGRVYSTEKDNNTLSTLRIYCCPQAIVFSKIVFNTVLLLGIACLTVLLFAAFFTLRVKDWVLFTVTIWLGVSGMAVVSTLMASLAAEARGTHALFTVINFPLLMPLLLTVTDLTTRSLQGVPADFDQVCLLIGFDLMIAAVTILVVEWL